MNIFEDSSVIEITDEQAVTKRDIIDNIDDRIKELYEDEEELLQKFLNKVVDESENGYQYSLARICQVPKDEKEKITKDGYCECYKMCLLHRNEKAPVGFLCPFEQAHIANTSRGIIKNVGVNPDRDFVDMQTISDYVGYSLIKYRSFRNLASESITVVSSEETKFGTNYIRSTNPHLDAIVMAENAMSKIKKELIATRESKVSLKIEAAKVNVKDKKEKELYDKITDQTSVGNNKLGLL